MSGDDVKLGLIIVFGGGLGLMIVWFILVSIVQLGQRSLAWIDDNTEQTYNILIDKAALLLDCRIRTNSKYRYYDDEGDAYSSGEILFGVGILYLFPTPCILYFAYLVYPLTISILIYVAILYIARMVKRQSKMMKSHINDKTVHKE